MTVQSIIFDKTKWTKTAAEKWLDREGYKKTYYGKGADETRNYYRFRQTKPNDSEYYFTKTVDNGVKLIIKSH